MYQTNLLAYVCLGLVVGGGADRTSASVVNRHVQSSSVETKARALRRRMHEELLKRSSLLQETGSQPTEYSEGAGAGTALVVDNGSGMV